MKHSVEVNNDDTVEIRVVGNISGPESTNLSEKIMQFTEKPKNTGHLKLLANFTHAGKHGIHSAKLFKNIFKNLIFQKFAFYGLDRLPSRIFTEEIKVSNLQEKVRLFHTRDEASLWLTD